MRADYPIGTDIDGIKWQPGMSELIVSIVNPTDRDYKDLDFSILSPEPVREIKQATAIPCVPVSENVVNVTGTGPGGSEVLHQLLTAGPLRFRCQSLPKRTTIQFVLAIVNADNLMSLLSRPKPGEALPHGMWGPKRKPKWVGVGGTYRVAFRPYSFRRKVDVGSG